MPSSPRSEPKLTARFKTVCRAIDDSPNDPRLLFEHEEIVLPKKRHRRWHAKACFDCSDGQVRHKHRRGAGLGLLLVAAAAFAWIARSFRNDPMADEAVPEAGAAVPAD